jgi:lipoate-protein ligase A
MQLLDLTLKTSAENIALDEALLEAAEIDEGTEVLRLWEPTVPLVVAGRSSSIQNEVKLDVCRARAIEVFRRCSGGATIAAAPHCQMYAVLLDYRKRPELRMLEQAHRFVINRMQTAIESLGIQVAVEGICDLVLNNRKFSGNALRCKRNWMFYHGTILCKSFDLSLVSELLGPPQRQPDYRENRDHLDFLTVLPADPQSVRQAIIEQWNAFESKADWPVELTKQLSAEKYLADSWTYRIR